MAYKIQWECCCEDRCCDKKKKDIEIKAWTCIDVDKSVEWEYTINNTMEIDVKSTDGTVHVKKTGNDCQKTYDLSVDCEDKKVWVCDEDTPWFLKDKIAGISPIYTQPICSSDWVVQIGLDQSKLDLPDEKVAVVQGCKGKYLNDALDVNSSYIEAKVDTDRCVLIIKDKEMRQKPLIRVRLIHSDIQTQVVKRPGTQDTDRWYVLSNPNWWQSAGIKIPSSYAIDFSIWEAQGTWITRWLDNDSWLVVCPMDWIYRISYGWCLEISSWVIAWRTYLLQWWGTDTWLLESRWGGGNGTLDMIPADEKYEWYKKYWAPHFYNVTNQVHHQSLGKYVARQSFSWTTLTEARVWDLFWLGLKISTSLDDDAYDYSKPAAFQIQSESDDSIWGWDRGAHIEIEYVAPLTAAHHF